VLTQLAQAGFDSVVQTAWDVKSALPSPPLRYFSYMPLMHSEDLEDQEVSQQLSLLAVGSTNSHCKFAAGCWFDQLQVAVRLQGQVQQLASICRQHLLAGCRRQPHAALVVWGECASSPFLHDRFLCNPCHLQRPRMG
jgi:hypothetical protein